VRAALPFTGELRMSIWKKKENSQEDRILHRRDAEGTEWSYK
jgi:hypothetical protein